ncbi:ABC transporter permease [Demequina litorisediminis]|uniref:ABC transporter permease n=1 Tax=Demequina litorisediminis TaxID=1849022 RepID=A0ABQ6ICL4_9MICO|nr:ABC transporter permease [Demequina litorisediminis]
MSDRNAHYVAPVDETQPGAVDQVRLSSRKSNMWIDAWRDLRRRPLFYVALALSLVFLAMALFPSLFTSADPNFAQLSDSNGPAEPGHPLGFNRQGYDVWSHIVYGARTSLTVGLLTVLITGVIGVPMGAIAGYYGGWVDSLLSRVGDIFFSIPYFLAAVVVMSVLSDYRNPLVIAFAIGGFAWASLARIVRAEVLRNKNLEYVMASEAVGRSRGSTLLRHVLPNSMGPVIVALTLSLGAAITAEATLSVLGIGLSGYVSWGNDIAQAQQTLRTNPSVLFWPSLALTLTVLAFTFLGEAHP